MADFTPKPLTKSSTLGERLRELREESRTTVQEAAQATGVPVHHLQALEDGAYNRLPGDVYTRNFLRRYARWLKLNEERVLESYDSERSVVRPHERRLPPPLKLPSAWTVTLLAKRTIIVLVVIAILGYLGYEVSKIIAPPSLVLETPASNVATDSQSYDVNGKTDPGVAVFVNGQSTFVSEDGHFRETITLRPGRNTLQVTAVKKRGKRYTVSREIILQETPAKPTPNQPN